MRGVLIWLCITGIIYSAILAIKYGTIEPEITPEVDAFKDKAATIAVIIPACFLLILWLISLIITQLDKQKLATLTKELELQSSERERIEDKMNSILRKLEIEQYWGVLHDEC
jgi:Na+/melibiose symporter-like transporter